MKCFIVFFTCTVESHDRSTTREYGDLNTEMNHKYEKLKASEEEATKRDDEHYKSILRQVRTDRN